MRNISWRSCLLAAGALAVSAAFAGSTMAAPVTINVIDVAGDLQVSQPALEKFQAEHPDLVSKFVFTQATATDSTNVLATLGTGSNITASKGTVTVDGTWNPTTSANAPGTAVGIGAVFSALITTATVNGSNKASVGEGVTINSTGLTVEATSTVNPTADQTINLSVGAATGSGSSVTATCSRSSVARSTWARTCSDVVPGSTR